MKIQINTENAELPTKNTNEGEDSDNSNHKGHKEEISTVKKRKIEDKNKEDARRVCFSKREKESHRRVRGDKKERIRQ